MIYRRSKAPSPGFLFFMLAVAFAIWAGTIIYVAVR